jgi:hypothetical protein
VRRIDRQVLADDGVSVGDLDLVDAARARVEDRPAPHAPGLVRRVGEEPEHDLWRCVDVDLLLDAVVQDGHPACLSFRGETTAVRAWAFGLASPVAENPSMNSLSPTSPDGSVRWRRWVPSPVDGWSASAPRGV